MMRCFSHTFLCFGKKLLVRLKKNGLKEYGGGEARKGGENAMLAWLGRVRKRGRLMKAVAHDCEYVCRHCMVR